MRVSVALQVDEGTPVAVAAEAGAAPQLAERVLARDVVLDDARRPDERQPAQARRPRRGVRDLLVRRLNRGLPATLALRGLLHRADRRERQPRRDAVDLEEVVAAAAKAEEAADEAKADAEQAEAEAEEAAAEEEASAHDEAAPEDEADAKDEAESKDEAGAKAGSDPEADAEAAARRRSRRSTRRRPRASTPTPAPTRATRTPPPRRGTDEEDAPPAPRRPADGRRLLRLPEVHGRRARRRDPVVAQEKVEKELAETKKQRKKDKIEGPWSRSASPSWSTSPTPA